MWIDSEDTVYWQFFLHTYKSYCNLHNGDMRGSEWCVLQKAVNSFRKRGVYSADGATYITAFTFLHTNDTII